MNDQIWNALTPFIPLLSGIAGSAAGALLAGWYAIKKLRKEISAHLEREKYVRLLDACTECWKLLAFTTEVENKSSILVWSRDAQRQERYFMRIDQAKAFIDALSHFFYESGKGLYLPRSVRPLLFEYRNSVYGVLLKEKENAAPQVELHNEHLIKRMKAIHQQLVELLRKEVGLMDPILPDDIKSGISEKKMM